jgi:hypothetical protein
MDLDMNGRITAELQRPGPGWRGPWEEWVLSEFVINTVEVQGPAMGGEEQTRLPEDGKSVGVVGRPPWTATTPGIPLLTPMTSPGPDFDLERWYEWTQTRLPWPERRSDGPLRRPDDPPYSESMSFNTRKGGEK